MRASDSTKRICSRKSESSLGAVPAAELVNIELDDLPDVVLVEILCRLPCYKFVLKCKSVSKRWFNVMSGPYFLGRFLCLQSDRDETPIIRSLITDTGQEFLNRMATTTKPLGPLFEKLMSVQQLEKEPVVVATYNDLVLCSTTGFYQRDYYICNPCTIQWVAVPPPPRVYKYTPVGLICDLPYFNCTKDDQGGSVIQVNAEFRCRIVRLVLPENESVTELEVQIFASDTSQWITSTISIPSGVICDTVPIERSFTYNGMLYFVGDEPGDQNFLLGLDPFLINNSIIDRYQFIRFDDPNESFVLRYFGEYRGCLHMCDYDHYKFFVRELKAEELCGGAGKLSVEGIQDYTLDIGNFPPYCGQFVSLLFLDPNNEHVIYLHICNDIVRYDLQTREWSKLAGNIPSHDQFLFVVPWWPTPVPRLLQHAQPAGINF